jgi:DNA ligase-1
MRGYNQVVKFEKLAQYLEELESTSSRLSMTNILARMFSEVSSVEGKTIAYLSAGMLGPKHNNPDTGMAEKQVLKAVAMGTDMDLSKVNEEFKSKGDLGKTAETIKSVNINQKTNSSIDVQTVFERLVQIAQTGGQGSQDKKIEHLADLIKELDGRSAKYAVKIVLGKMRSGFSDMTVLDALSWMKTGNKSLREDIEKIYNVRADLGEVVRLVCEHKDVKTIKVDPVWGVPILVARAERAKSALEIWERLGRAAAEHKLDGLRIQAHVKNGEVMLFSRGMDNVTAMYPDIVQGLRDQVSDECILDGEMIAVGKDGKYLPFQETVQRKRKYDIMEMMEQVPLKYYTFDTLMFRGRSLLNEPNETRWKQLESIVGKGRIVRLMPRKIVTGVAEIEEFFYASLAEGTEGVVVKKLDGVYRSGSRDFNWIKYKKSYDESGVADTIDAVVMGYDVGQGKRSGFGIGGFLIGVAKGPAGGFLTIAKIGTGLTDDEWREMKKRCDEIKISEKPEDYEVEKQMNCDVWVKPKIVVEIKCDEITKSPMHSAGFALRFPRLVSFREMKVDEIATASEIERLFGLQKK